MRKSIIAAALCLFATSAFAAEPAAVNWWSGAYVGLNAGYAGSNLSVLDTNGGVTPGPFTYSTKGFTGGGYAGYNWQVSNLLFGIEGDLGYLGATGKGYIPSSNPNAHQDLTLDSGLYGDATGRVGYAFNRFMVYGKGGYAYFGGSAKQTTTNPGYVTTGTGSWNGYTYGGGLEYALSPGVSVKLEYLRYDFGSRGGMQTSVGDPPIGYHYLNNTSLRFDTVRVGVGTHF